MVRAICLLESDLIHHRQMGNGPAPSCCPRWLTRSVLSTDSRLRAVSIFPLRWAILSPGNSYLTTRRMVRRPPGIDTNVNQQTLAGRIITIRASTRGKPVRNSHAWPSDEGLYYCSDEEGPEQNGRCQQKGVPDGMELRHLEHLVAQPD